MTRVVEVVAVGRERVLVYPECPLALGFVSDDGSVVRCFAKDKGLIKENYKYCTAIRMEPSICPLDVKGHASY